MPFRDVVLHLLCYKWICICLMYGKTIVGSPPKDTWLFFTLPIFLWSNFGRHAMLIKHLEHEPLRQIHRSFLHDGRDMHAASCWSRYQGDRHSFHWSEPAAMRGKCVTIIFLRLFTYSFLEREEGRERKKGRETSMWERNIHRFPLERTLNRDQAHNPGMCPDWESNRWPFTLQVNAQPTQSYWSELRH